MMIAKSNPTGPEQLLESPVPDAAGPSSALRCLPRSAFLEAASSPPANLPSKMGPLADPMPSDALLEIMLGALAPTRSERVLELGSRAGYETALLCHLAGQVVSLVSDAEVAEVRTRLLKALGCQNVEVVVAPGGGGWPSAAPYSAILVASGATHVPAALLDQLELNGRLVIPLGDASGQLLELVHRHVDGMSSQTLGPCHLSMLPWASRRPSQFPWNR